MSERKKQIIVNWVMAIVIPLAIFLLYYLIAGITEYQKALDNNPDNNPEPSWTIFFSQLRLYSDGFCLGGGLVLAFIGLAWIGRQGTFDVVRYGFYRLVESFKRGDEKRYETAYDYTQAKKEKRDKEKPFFIPYLIVGGLFLTVGIVLAIIQMVQ